MGRRAIAGHAQEEPKRRNVAVQCSRRGRAGSEAVVRKAFALGKRIKVSEPQGCAGKASRSLPTLSFWLPPQFRSNGGTHGVSGWDLETK